MKNLVKWFVLSFAFVLLVGTSVCYAGATYDRVNEAGEVKVGLMYNSIPAAYFNDKNEWVGFDVEHGNTVVELGKASDYGHLPVGMERKAFHTVSYLLDDAVYDGRILGEIDDRNIAQSA